VPAATLGLALYALWSRKKNKRKRADKEENGVDGEGDGKCGMDSARGTC
jgi:hypothetical protein